MISEELMKDKLILFTRIAVHLERHQSLDAHGQLFSQLYHLLRRRIEVQVRQIFYQKEQQNGNWF